MGKGELYLFFGTLPAQGRTSGAAIAFESVVEGFQEREIRINVIDFKRGHHVEVSGEFALKKLWLAVLSVFEVWVYLWKAKALYLTHANSKFGLLRNILVVLPARLLGVKVIAHCHGGGSDSFYNNLNTFSKFLYRKYLRLVNCLIVMGRLLTKEFDGIITKHTRVCVIPYGLPSNVRASTITNKKGIGEVRRILYLSNLIPSKGFTYLIEAIALLKLRSKKCYQLDICGSFLGTVEENEHWDEDLLRNYINELDVGDRVSYHGAVHGDKKNKILQDAHVMALPTAYPWEAQPICLIEGMALGMPLISTQYRGIPEELEDGYNGYFVEAGSPQSIAEGIEKIFEGPIPYEALSANARKHYEKHFVREHFIERVIEVITR